ncbi:armadillo-type protein [Mycena polygramma]|nr:armadillo-type protein [Mycena polygramma]
MVRQSTLHFLSTLSQHPDGAEALGEICQIWQHLTVLLDDPESLTHELAVKVLRNVAIHEAASLSRNESVDIMSEETIEAQRRAVRQVLHIARILGKFLLHRPHSIDQLGLEFRMRVCMRLVDSDDENIDSAVRDSEPYPRLPHNIPATATWEDCYDLLATSNPGVRRFACNVLGNIAVYNSPMDFLLSSPYLQIVALLSDNDFEVRQCAVYALSKMSYWFRDAQAILEARILDCVSSLLDSDHNETLRCTCEKILGNLVSHDARSLILWPGLDICSRLVYCLSDEGARVRQGAILALYKISNSALGAGAIGSTDIVKYITNLLECNLSRLYTCVTADNLASYGALPKLSGELHASIRTIARDENVIVTTESWEELDEETWSH